MLLFRKTSEIIYVGFDFFFIEYVKSRSALVNKHLKIHLKKIAIIKKRKNI